MIPRIAPRSCPWSGDFHARTLVLELFSSTCSFFLLFTSTLVVIVRCRMVQPLRALKLPTCNVPSWRRGLVGKDAALGPAGESRGVFACPLGRSANSGQRGRRFVRLGFKLNIV